MGRVNGKIAIVTGGARGMGAAHAQRLIFEGAKVMLTDVLDKEGEETARRLAPARDSCIMMSSARPNGSR